MIRLIGREKRLDVGIVVPCFNEADRWDLEYWQQLVDQSQATFLFVDDGSGDSTPELLAQLVDSSSAHSLRLSRNQGKAEAVRQGMNRLLESGSLSGVGYLDADGAFARDDVVALIEVFSEMVAKSESDAVWSSRVALAGRDIRRSEARHYIGRVIATYLSVSEESFPYDTQSGYKLFADNQALRSCLSTPFATRWLFEIELLARWRQATGAPMRIWEHPVNHWHDVPGSKIARGELIRVMRELWVVKALQRGNRPWPSRERHRF